MIRKIIYTLILYCFSFILNAQDTTLLCGDLVSINVYKGSSGDDTHGVDGISGATVTSNGVTNFLKHALNEYKSYLVRTREDNE